MDFSVSRNESSLSSHLPSPQTPGRILNASRLSTPYLPDWPFGLPPSICSMECTVHVREHTHQMEGKTKIGHFLMLLKKNGLK